jgi:uncharacterized RDD family membrane protein YckC
LLARPAPPPAGARGLPAAERLAAAVVDFGVLAVPQVIVAIAIAGHQFSRYASFVANHSKDTHLATNPTFVKLAASVNATIPRFLLVSEAITAVYLIGMYLATGATLGKLVMGLRITRVDGSPMTPRDAVLRSLVFWVPLLIPAIGLWLWLAQYIGGTLVVLFRPDHRGPEDLLGRTIVVRKESQGRSLAELFSPARPGTPTFPPPSPPAARGGHLPGWGPADEPPAGPGAGKPEDIP